jgi:hypothetical protein
MAGNRTKCDAWAEVPRTEGLTERMEKEAPAMTAVYESKRRFTKRKITMAVAVLTSRNPK